MALESIRPTMRAGVAHAGVAMPVVSTLPAVVVVPVCVVVDDE
jgi:hypothetical protein